MNHDWQTILWVGGEGGSIKLLGKELSPGNWIFKKSINEISYDLPEEQDFQSNSKSRTVKSRFTSGNEADSWEKAVNLMERYPWPMLHPHEVHPAFRKQVWQEIQKFANEKYKNRFDSFRRSRWSRLCFPGISEAVFALGEWLKESTYTTILTGAGMSTESNIPDFRSKEGWWRKIDPQTVATTEALENHYELFHEFYSMRINGLKSCKPHKGHEILASWEQKGLINAVITQNVDGFHKEAGNKNVYELHGSIHSIRCENCGRPASEEQFLKKQACETCGGKLRPGVVLFGETLPQDAWRAALNQISNSDLVIVIGTSLEVYPASKLPEMTNGKTVYINKEIELADPHFDLIIEGKAGEVLKPVDELL